MSIYSMGPGLAMLSLAQEKWDREHRFQQLNAIQSETFPGLKKAFLVIGEVVLTFWFDEDRVIRHWHTTDWDFGWEDIKRKALEWGLKWEG